jgi:hypothetical protein
VGGSPELSDYALGRMAGSRGDVGMSDWSVETILEHGTTEVSYGGRTVTTLENFGHVVVNDDGTIKTVVPYGREAGEDFQGWFVEMLVFVLGSED